MSDRRRWLRWLASCVGLCAFVLALAALIVAFAVGTASGRARLLGVLLAQVDPRIPGRLEVDRLERLDPFVIRLDGVRLYDPASSEVLALSTLRVELAPLELLRGRFVLRSIALGPSHIDLRDLDTRGRGLLGALMDPDASVPPGDGSDRTLPYVRIDAISITDLNVTAPALAPPWGDLRIEHLDAAASLEIDGAPELSLHSLSCDVRRGARPLLRLARATAHVARPGVPSTLAFGLELGEARLSAMASAIATPSSALETSPLGAELHLSGLRAGTLSALLDQPELAQAYAGPAALDVSVSGSLTRLTARGALGTNAGTLALHAELGERRWLELHATARELVASELRADLPAPPLSFEISSSLDLADPDRIPIALRVRSARFGAALLPELSTSGHWNGQRLADLRIDITRGQSVLGASGHVDVEGSFVLAVAANVRSAELSRWAMAAGLAPVRRGMLSANLRLERTPSGVLSIQGGARARAVRLPGLSLDDARVEVDLHGPPLALAGRAELRLGGFLSGGLHVPRAELRLEGGPTEYRLRAAGDVERLSATLNLRARRAAERFIVRGSARGTYARVPFELGIQPTTLDPLGWVETAGIELDVGGQRVILTGGYGRASSVLSLALPELDVAELAQLAGVGSGWSGHGQLALSVRGRPEAPVLKGALKLVDLSRNGEARLEPTSPSSSTPKAGARASTRRLAPIRRQAGSRRRWL